MGRGRRWLSGIATVMVLSGLTSGAARALEADVLHAVAVAGPPTIDGVLEPSVWARAPAIRVRDAVADLEITVQAVYAQGRVFLAAAYDDDTEDRQHKRLIWDRAEGRYRIGPRREDTLVLKWNMSPYPVDLTLRSDRPYEADIWYWKADRTDCAGYADDKVQYYADQNLARGKVMTSAKGDLFFLSRDGDQGRPAYVSELYTTYQGAEVPRYRCQEPSASRADIRAKGRWAEGRWTIEFARALRTGNADDVQFDLAEQYDFGVSRYEIAGRAAEPDIDQPMFGAGDVGRLLRLRFESAVGFR